MSLFFPCARCSSSVRFRRFRALRAVWGYLDVRGMRFLTSPPHPEGALLCLPCVRQAVAQKEDLRVVVTPDVLEWSARTRGMKPKVLRREIGARIRARLLEEKRKKGAHDVWTKKAEAELRRRDPWSWGLGLFGAHRAMVGVMLEWWKKKRIGAA